MCQRDMRKRPPWALTLKSWGIPSRGARARLRREWKKPHLGLSCLGDRLHREPLPRVVLHSAENDKSNRRPLFFYYFQNILFSKGELPFTGEHLDDSIFGIEAM